MKRISTFILLLLSLNINAQTKKSDCEVFWKNYTDSLTIKKGNKDPNYSYILRQLNAYKACSPENYKKADTAIIRINKKILDLRNKADNLRIIAEKERDRAEKERNKATAFFYASESENLAPNQGIRLLMEAIPLCSDTNARNAVNYQFKQIFNNSNKHQFKEARRYNSRISYGDRPVWLNQNFEYSPNGKWLLTKNKGYEVKLLYIPTGKVVTFLENEKDNLEVFFSPNSFWLITKKGDGILKFWDLESGKYDKVLNSMNAVNFKFSPDCKFLALEKIGKIFEILNLSTHKPLNIEINKEVFSYEFSSNSRFLIVKVDWFEYDIIQLSDGKRPSIINDLGGLQYILFSQNSKLTFIKNKEHKCYILDNDLQNKY
jgi:hypothetical protein